jgi:hypothetical protein
MSMLTTDKITEIFCIADDFCKEFSKEMKKVPQLPQGGKRRLSQKGDFKQFTPSTIYCRGGKVANSGLLRQPRCPKAKL